MEDVVYALIPIVAIGGFFAWMISLSPVGKALSERIRRAGPPTAGHEELVEAVDQLRREVAELAERVDFTERLVAQARASSRLEAPR